jgi:hypothetical protein
MRLFIIWQYPSYGSVMVAFMLRNFAADGFINNYILVEKGTKCRVVASKTNLMER